MSLLVLFDLLAFLLKNKLVQSNGIRYKDSVDNKFKDILTQMAQLKLAMNTQIYYFWKPQ